MTHPNGSPVASGATVLYYSSDPPSGGFALNLGNADPALAPPDLHGSTPEEYLGHLRAAHRRDPRPFVALAREARAKELTLYSLNRPDLATVLYRAIVAVAAQRGWAIDGGYIAPRPKDVSGRYVPR